MLLPLLADMYGGWWGGLTTAGWIEMVEKRAISASLTQDGRSDEDGECGENHLCSGTTHDLRSGQTSQAINRTITRECPSMDHRDDVVRECTRM